MQNQRDQNKEKHNEQQDRKPGSAEEAAGSRDKQRQEDAERERELKKDQQKQQENRDRK